MNIKTRSTVVVALITLLLAAFASVARADPPSRVLRVSFVQGSVSFAPAGSDEWVYATVNRPVVYGDRLWVDQDGRGELEMGHATLWLGPQTSIDVMNLDDRIAQFDLSQGEAVLQVRGLGSGESVEIDTPNLAFVVTRPGRYRVDVDAQGGATLVAVSDGSADVYGEQASYAIARGKRYRFYGADLADAEIVAPSPPDDIERFASDRERRYTRGASARYVSTEVIGAEDLDAYGTWTSVADYGNVWVPRDVPADWAPYRDGHWAWIDPWGWTWVDDAPWGFAPFHYGRWAYAQQRWCWVPGPVDVRPVYAPALVAFVGGAGIGIAVSSGPSIGWFPLGPREVYRPPYDASPRYIRQVNVSNTRITNVTVINNIINNPTTVTQINQFVNLRAPNAVTAVAPATMAQSQPVARARVQLQANAIDKSQISQLAKIAPTQQALAGSARAAQAKPPAQVTRRTVVARTAPPPPPMPSAQKIQLLQRDPGRSLPPRQAATPPARGEAPGKAPAGPAAQPGGAPAAAGARTTPNVRVVNAAQPTPTKAPPAKPAGEVRRGAGAAGQAPEEARRGAGQPPAGPPSAGARPPAGEAPAAAPGAPAGRPPVTRPGATPKAPEGAAKLPAERSPSPGEAPKGPAEGAGTGEAPKAPGREARKAPQERPATGPTQTPPLAPSRPGGEAPQPPAQAAPTAPPARAPEAAPPPASRGRPELAPRESAPRGPAPPPPAAAPQPAPESRAAPTAPPREPSGTPAARPREAPQPAPAAAPREAPHPPPAAAPREAAHPAPAEPREAPRPPPAARPAPAPQPEAAPRPAPQAAPRPAPAPPGAAQPAPQRPGARPPERPPEKKDDKDNKDKDNKG